jgi:hypothetical protein
MDLVIAQSYKFHRFGEVVRILRRPPSHLSHLPVPEVFRTLVHRRTVPTVRKIVVLSVQRVFVIPAIH